MDYRDSVIFPYDDTGDVLWRMHCDGDNLSAARDIDFQVVFVEQGQAELFRAYMESSGRKANITYYADQPEGRFWDVQISIPMVPTHAAITAFEDRLEEDASMGGGYNDGWGSFQQP